MREELRDGGCRDFGVARGTAEGRLEAGAARGGRGGGEEVLKGTEHSSRERRQQRSGTVGVLSVGGSVRGEEETHHRCLGVRGCAVQGRATVLVPESRVRTCCEERRDALETSLLRGAHESRSAGGVLGVDPRPRFEQQPKRALVTASCGRLQRCRRVVLVRGSDRRIQVSAHSKQTPRCGRLVLAACSMQRALAVLVQCIHVRACSHEHLAEGRVASTRSEVQGGAEVGGARLSVGSAREEQFQHRPVPVPRRVVQCNLAMLERSVHRLTCIKETLHHLELTLAGCLIEIARTAIRLRTTRRRDTCFIISAKKVINQ